MSDFHDPQKNNVVVLNFGSSSPKRAPVIPEDKALNEKKQHLFREWLSYGVVSVLLDSSLEGVKVPPNHAGKSELVLNFSYDFQVPDFNFNDVGIWATLSFAEGEYFCMVPWSSVIGLHSEAQKQGARWFLDFSDEEAHAQCASSDEPSEEHYIEKNNVIEFDFSNKNIF